MNQNFTDEDRKQLRAQFVDPTLAESNGLNSDMGGIGNRALKVESARKRVLSLIDSGSPEYRIESAIADYRDAELGLAEQVKMQAMVNSYYGNFNFL